MIKRKNYKTKGKVKLSEYFQEFKEGERVAVKQEPAFQPKFPSKLQGRSGTVNGKRGRRYTVKINDLDKEKTYIIHPVHLRKLNQEQIK